MRRRWLVAAALCLAAADASANPPPPIAPRFECECLTPDIRPARDAVVPTNAKIWVLGTTENRGALQSGATSTPVIATFDTIEVFTPALEAGRTYGFHAGMLSTAFTVGTEADHTPPRAPQVRSVSITVSDRDLIPQLDLDADFSSDTELVRITMATAHRATSIVVLPGHLHLCHPDLPISGPVTVEIRAVDLAGNESEAATSQLTIAIGTTGLGPTCKGELSTAVHRHRGEATGLLLLVGGTFVFAVIAVLLVTFVVKRLTRGRDDASSPAEPISLLVAEPLARMTRRALGLELVIGCAILGVGWWFQFAPSALVVIYLGFVLNSFLNAGHAARELAKPGAGAELRATCLTVCTNTGAHYSMRVSRRAIARARRHGVPVARAG